MQSASITRQRGDSYYASRADEGRVISENFTPECKYFPHGAARHNKLSVELSWWRALTKSYILA